jgi:hypothetical protein
MPALVYAFYVDLRLETQTCNQVNEFHPQLPRSGYMYVLLNKYLLATYPMRISWA